MLTKRDVKLDAKIIFFQAKTSNVLNFPKGNLVNNLRTSETLKKLLVGINRNNRRSCMRLTLRGITRLSMRSIRL